MALPPISSSAIIYGFETISADLTNVFEVFLPQLLLYPNPSDPLNGEAAALMMRDRTAYEQRVKGKLSHIRCLYVIKISSSFKRTKKTFRFVEFLVLCMVCAYCLISFRHVGSRLL